MTACTLEDRTTTPDGAALSGALSTEDRRLQELRASIVGNLPEPAWAGLEECLGKLLALTELRQGWDGYSSPPILANCLARAVGLSLSGMIPTSLPAPRVAPVAGGGLQLEWEVEGRELELEFRPGGSTEYLLVDGDHQEEGEVGLPSPQLKKLLDWLSGL